MKIRADLQGHFWAGLAICLAVSLFTAPVIGLVIALAVGAAKEIVDSMGFGTPDKWDLVATAAGGLVGYGLLIVSMIN